MSNLNGYEAVMWITKQCINANFLRPLKTFFSLHCIYLYIVMQEQKSFKLTLHRNLCTCSLGFFHTVICSTHILPTITSLAFLNVYSCAQLISILGPCYGWSWSTTGITSQLKTIALIDGLVLRRYNDCWRHWKEIKTNIVRLTGKSQPQQLNLLLLTKSSCTKKKSTRYQVNLCNSIVDKTYKKWQLHYEGMKMNAVLLYPYVHLWRRFPAIILKLLRFLTVQSYIKYSWSFLFHA